MAEQQSSTGLVAFWITAGIIVLAWLIATISERESALGLGAVEPGPRWGQVRTVETRVNIRAERTTDAAVSGKLDPGDLVLAHKCEDNPGSSVSPNDGTWCAVYFTYQDNGPAETATPRGYVYEPLLKPVVASEPRGEVAPRRTAPPTTRRPRSPPRRSTGCCKICRKGKACGNSCIARNKTCRKGPGCACNG